MPKRLRYPEKKPVLKKRPVTEPKQQPKPPIQTLVKNPSINVDEFSAPAAPIKQQNIVSVFGSKIWIVQDLTTNSYSPIWYYEFRTLSYFTRLILRYKIFVKLEWLVLDSLNESLSFFDFKRIVISYETKGIYYIALYETYGVHNIS